MGQQIVIFSSKNATTSIGTPATTITTSTTVE